MSTLLVASPVCFEVTTGAIVPLGAESPVAMGVRERGGFLFRQSFVSINLAVDFENRHRIRTGATTAGRFRGWSRSNARPLF